MKKLIFTAVFMTAGVVFASAQTKDVKKEEAKKAESTAVKKAETETVVLDAASADGSSNSKLHANEDAQPMKSTEKAKEIQPAAEIEKKENVKVE